RFSGAGGAVQRSHGPEGRPAAGGADARDRAARAERHPPAGRELAEEIVRMLAVDVLELVVRFAHLEELRVAARRDRHRLERQHPPDGELSGAERVPTRSPDPALRSKLRLAALP